MKATFSKGFVYLFFLSFSCNFKTMDSNSCTDLAQQILDTNWSDWKGLPGNCRLKDLQPTWTPAGDGAEGQSKLGAARKKHPFRTYQHPNWFQPARVWHQDEQLLLIEITYPRVEQVAELLDLLGSPAGKLDYYFRRMEYPEGAWVYPDRGLALFMNGTADQVLKLLLFESLSLEAYTEDLHPAGEEGRRFRKE